MFAHFLCWLFFLCSPFTFWCSREVCCGLLLLSFHMFPQVISSFLLASVATDILRDLGLSPEHHIVFSFSHEYLQFDDVTCKPQITVLQAKLFIYFPQSLLPELFLTKYFCCLPSYRQQTLTYQTF